MCVGQREDSEPPLVGAQLVAVNDIEVLGFTLEEVMGAMRDAQAPGEILRAKLRVGSGAHRSMLDRQVADGLVRAFSAVFSPSVRVADLRDLTSALAPVSRLSSVLVW